MYMYMYTYFTEMGEHTKFANLGQIIILFVISPTFIEKYPFSRVKTKFMWISLPIENQNFVLVNKTVYVLYYMCFNWPVYVYFSYIYSNCKSNPLALQH